MIVVDARNVNDAFYTGMSLISSDGVMRPSRAGQVLLMDGPVTTVYDQPKERVLFSPSRDANPFFHFMEGLWMISGRNDVEWISRFNANMSSFSDDGTTFHGAYGFRWRQHFGFDQLATIISLLKSNPDDRRIVLQMWDAQADLNKIGKDFPCNIEIMFRVSLSGHLDMTVVNRSNDMIWGAYGANVVHMSMLQEYVAGNLEIPVGRYWQISNNFHAYTKVMTPLVNLLQSEAMMDPYEMGVVCPYPMINGDPLIWDQDLAMFMDQGPIVGFRDKFFRRVVTPIWSSYLDWKKNKKLDIALEILSNCQATDWKKACGDWLIRRAAK